MERLLPFIPQIESKTMKAPNNEAFQVVSGPWNQSVNFASPLGKMCLLHDIEKLRNLPEVLWRKHGKSIARMVSMEIVSSQCG